MRKSVVFFAKWVWIVGVIAAAGYFLAREWDEMRVMLRQVSLPLVAESIALTAIAKLGLAQNARLAALRNGISLRFTSAARLYNLSQLGKYLPGSIWQFVGRAAAYRRLGAAYAPIRDSLLIESLWVVAAAALVGLVLTGPVAVRLVLESLTPLLRAWLAGGTLMAVVAFATLLVLRKSIAARYLRLALPSWQVALTQGAIWLFLGLAFWVLARACNLDVNVGFATGLFAAAYAVGFIVPFAPAGLGIRDAILTLGLLPHAPTGEALALTVLARAVYLVVDVGLVVVQESLLSVMRGLARCNDG